MIRMGVQVGDVQKPLSAASRIVEEGEIVQFGPDAEDNSIQNVSTKEKCFHDQKNGLICAGGGACNC